VWQARQSEKEAAVQRVQHLEVDNAELSSRLVEMKMTEMERINDVDQICNEMMRNAKNMERAAAAESSGRQVLGKFFGKPNGVRQGMSKATLSLLVLHLVLVFLGRFDQAKWMQGASCGFLCPVFWGFRLLGQVGWT